MTPPTSLYSQPFSYDPEAARPEGNLQGRVVFSSDNFSVDPAARTSLALLITGSLVSNASRIWFDSSLGMVIGNLSTIAAAAVLAFGCICGKQTVK